MFQQDGFERDSITTLRYKWTGKNTTYLNDRLYVSFDLYKPLILITLMVIQSTLYQILFEFDLLNSILLLIVIISILATSYRDPGILPKIFYKYEDDPQKLDIPQALKKKDQQYKQIIINDCIFRLKYCPTCKIYRTPRISHCGKCQNCVLKFDHHCIWIGNCVGSRNYLQFLLLLIIFILYFTTQMREMKTQLIMSSIIRFLFFFLCCLIMDILIIVLLCYHIFLIANNLTTVENVKHSWNSLRGNPYKWYNIQQIQRRSIYKNFRESFKYHNQKYVYLDTELYSNIPQNSQKPIEIQNVD
ncbi:hypothetical protein pb186bvf_015489 [Paramecium bursaria]